MWIEVDVMSHPGMTYVNLDLVRFISDEAPNGTKLHMTEDKWVMTSEPYESLISRIRGQTSKGE